MADEVKKPLVKFTSHPKANVAVVATAAVTLLLPILAHYGISLSGAEQSAADTLFVALCAYLAPNS